MRESKFRGKSRLDGKYYYGLPKYGSGGNIDYICGWGEEDGNSQYFEEECTDIVQYTGLKDKNGKEIYEGDIYISIIEDIKYVVTFKNGAFCGGVISSTSSPLGWDSMDYEGNMFEEPIEGDTSFLTVIGNIYENPELL